MRTVPDDATNTKASGVLVTTSPFIPVESAVIVPPTHLAGPPDCTAAPAVAASSNRENRRDIEIPFVITHNKSALAARFLSFILPLATCSFHTKGSRLANLKAPLPAGSAPRSGDWAPQ